jgi:carbonic anhydrase
MFKITLCLLSVMAGSVMSAEQDGLARLMQGNQRYVKDALICPSRTGERREALLSKQEPFAVIVGCSDSRVAPEIVFDQGVGDLFVVRVAGNVIGSLELESIAYSVIYLHSSTIVVLGHENCGAVNAVMEGTTKDVQSIAKLIEPSVTQAKLAKSTSLLEQATKMNALRMKESLLSSAPFKELVEQKKLQIYAGYYNLTTGEVEIL